MPSRFLGGGIGTFRQAPDRFEVGAQPKPFLPEGIFKLSLIQWAMPINAFQPKMITELGFEIEQTEDDAVKLQADRMKTVSGAELAEWLNCSSAAITQMKNAGKLVTDERGRYPLFESVRTYVTQLRNRKKGEQDGGASTGGLDRSLLFWKVENEKSKNLQWRMRYGSDIAQKILGQMAGSIRNFSHSLDKYPEAVQALKNLLADIEGSDVEAAVLETEDMEGEGEFTADEN